jgi:hypothetical protein
VAAPSSNPAPTPASSGSVAPAATPSPPASAVSPRPLARRLWPVIVAVVAVLVILAVIAFAVLSGPSGGVNATPSFSGARSSAGSVASATPGGPWTLVAAAGVVSPAGLSSSINSSVDSNCTFTPSSSSGFPIPIHVPAYGSYSTGGAPFWLMVYVDPAVPELLIVEVVNGTAQTLGTGTGLCASSLSALHGVPTGALDSANTSAEVMSGGGSAFVAAHANLSMNLLMAVYGGGTIPDEGLDEGLTGASWIYLITPCSESSQLSGKQPAYLALVNATTGQIDAVSTTLSCNATAALVPGGLFPDMGRAFSAGSFGGVSSATFELSAGTRFGQ